MSARVVMAIVAGLSAPCSVMAQSSGRFAGDLVPVSRPFTMIVPTTPRPLVQIPFDWQTRPVVTGRGTVTPYQPSPSPVAGTLTQVPVGAVAVQPDVHVQPLPPPASMPRDLVPPTSLPAAPASGTLTTAAGNAATAPAPGPVAAINHPSEPADIPAISPSPAEWQVRGGDTLKETLEAWAERAGWSVYYLTPAQFPLAPAEFDGDFPGAVERLVTAMASRRPIPTAAIHPANRSIVIRSIIVEDDE